MGFLSLISSLDRSHAHRNPNASLCRSRPSSTETRPSRSFQADWPRRERPPLRTRYNGPRRCGQARPAPIRSSRRCSLPQLNSALIEILPAFPSHRRHFADWNPLENFGFSKKIDIMMRVAFLTFSDARIHIPLSPPLHKASSDNRKWNERSNSGQGQCAPAIRPALRTSSWQQGATPPSKSTTPVLIGPAARTSLRSRMLS